MSSQLQEIDDAGVRAAFAGYGADPGGEIRVDTAAIAIAGRRRIRRHRVFAGAAGAVAVAALVGGVATVQNLSGGGDRLTTTDVAAGKIGDIPGTGRDVSTLFGTGTGAGTLGEQAIKSGGKGAELARGVAADLEKAPAYIDSAWRPGPDGSPRGSVRWGLLTWTEGDKAAEALVQRVDRPIYIAIYPPPYQTCRAADTSNGRTCDVRLIAGKGWLKVMRGAAGKSPELSVYLQHVGGGRTDQVSVTVRGGAATTARLAGNRADLGRLPVSEKSVVDAVLNVS